MTPKQAAAIARLSSFVESYAAMGGQDPEYVYSIHAGPDGGRSEHIRISDLRALLAMVNPATPTEPPPMPNNVPLTPEAARVVAAFDEVMDRAGVFEGSNDALAAALRELADQLCNLPIESRKAVWDERVRTYNRITAIAENIEQAVTYAPTEAPTDAQ